MVFSQFGTVHAAEPPYWNFRGLEYLSPNEYGGLTRLIIDMRVLISNVTPKPIYIEDYDSSMQLISRREVQLTGGLKTLGCIFMGADYNYAVYGQDNPYEDNNVEVIRVVKYSKNWEYIGHASIYGANTTIPFKSGSCRCDEAGGMLYIHTCHQMYKSRDGRNHQANMTLAVRESDMTLTDHYWSVSYASTGYVSHSFSQYILTDNSGNIVMLDLGDAYPRALVLSRFDGKAGSEKLGSASRTIIQEISGKTGDNYTGLNIYGFEETDGGYLTAYAYNGGSGKQTFYLAYTNKSDLSTRVVPITEPDGTCSTLRLVPAGTGGGYIVWNKETEGGTVVCYMNYASDGSLGPLRVANASIGASPTLFNGKIVWFESTRTNIIANDQYDIIVNICTMDDAGANVVTMPGFDPYQ